MTTYYLRTLGASNIEKSTVSVKKEVRGVAGESKADTATRDIATAAAASLAAATEVSSLSSNPPMASAVTSNLTPATSTPAKKTYTAEEKRVCSIEAMKNGEECEACQ